MTAYSNVCLRRVLVALIAVGVLPFASACDAPAKPAAALPSAPATSSAVSAMPSPSASVPPGPDLVTDPADEVLVPVMSGAGPGRTPSFAIATGVFTVRIACVGGGTATLLTDGKEHRVVCDDRMHRIHTVTDSRDAVVGMRATAAQRWSLTVVVTDAVRRT